MRIGASPYIIQRHEQVAAHPVGGALSGLHSIIQSGHLSFIPGFEGTGSTTRISQLALKEFGAPYGSSYGLISTAVVNLMANVTSKIVSYEYGLNK